MTTEHPIQPDELMAYLDGELPTDRASAAVAHLERCPDCQAFAAELRDISRQLLTWELEPPDAQMPARLATALKERQPEQEAVKPGSHPFLGRVMRRRWAFAAAFAVVCLVVGLGIKFTIPTYNYTPEKITTRLIEPGGGGGGYAAKTQSRIPAKNRLTPDSNGLFHGQGDHAENSFPTDSLDGLEPSYAAPQTSGPMIVRTAGITITTKDFDGARAALDQILKRHRGYVGEMNVSTPTGSGRSVTATLRVPADQLDTAMADLRKLGRVESESQSGQEVTAQYVDLQARLANARNTEQRLTDLLRQRTGKLSDVLAVETEIGRVRGEIESMEAERKNLAGQVDFATINATVGEDYKAELQVVPVSTSTRIRNAAVDGYRAMVDGAIGVVLFLFSYGPSLLLWGAILFFPARFAWRRVRQLGGKISD
ncbi:MAG TPA: DUF4349 domain-containing protein [Candidatus Sulfotelmatobacter sp.]|nr:DUF4349 domain-containing protein [Candidatus Sulfotelmatobacter sp.]